jgi:hypothetical protein
MHTAVVITDPVPAGVHAKHLGVLAEQFPRQQVLHRVQFMFDADTQLLALIEKSLPLFSIDKSGDFAGCDMGSDRA